MLGLKVMTREQKVRVTHCLTILSLLQGHGVWRRLKGQLLELTGHGLALRARGQARRPAYFHCARTWLLPFVWVRRCQIDRLTCSLKNIFFNRIKQTKKHQDNNILITNGNLRTNELMQTFYQSGRWNLILNIKCRSWSPMKTGREYVFVSCR